jgi:hypothetical protein
VAVAAVLVALLGLGGWTWHSTRPPCSVRWAASRRASGR